MKALHPWLAFAAGGAVALAIAGAAYIYRGQDGHAAPQVASAPKPAPARIPVAIDQGQARSIGVQVAAVSLSAIGEEMRVAATVAPEESRLSHIHTRVAGWIEKLHVANTGEQVVAGQPIVDIYSQELYSSQVEYLAARRFAGPPSLVADSGRTRLQLFGMSEADIGRVERSGQPRRVVTLYAPRSGILAKRAIAVGTAVDPSTEIATVLDLSRVWVVAEVPAALAGQVRTGMSAQLAFTGAAGASRRATVEFVDPMLNESTRTLRIRFSLPNQDGSLRPGMYGSALLQLPKRQGLTVPRDAVVDTGDSRFVYVVQADGSFAPRAVRLGTRLKDAIEIVDGLHQGERIVSSGVFLLDSESRLRASGNQGAHGGHGDHGAPPAPAAGHQHDAGGAGHD